jgi:hypothetical protein
MALDKSKLKRVTFPSSDMQLGVASYNVVNDNLATILAPNYFSGVVLRSGDIIMVSGADNETCIVVDTVTSNPDGIAISITTKTLTTSQLLAFDQLTATALTTSLTSFSSASGGTAVGVTQVEYALLQAISGTIIGGSSNSVLNSGNGVGFTAGFTEGNWNTYTPLPTAKTPFAFAFNIGAVSTVVQMKVGSVSALSNIHNNTVVGANGLLYYVIKTPAITTVASSIVAGFNNGGGFGSATSLGSYNYDAGNVLAISTAVAGAGTQERRYQVIAR